MKVVKSEKDVLVELEELCTSSGYIHAIAYLCFRDNIFRTDGDEPSVEDLLKLYSHDRLIRTEISTLLGLLVKKEIDYTNPNPETLQTYIDKTDLLLKELHDAINAPAYEIFFDILKNEKNENPFTRGKILKETIFYSAESAYDFQYLDLFPQKYNQDSKWIKDNKGFSVDDIQYVISAFIDLQLDKVNDFKNKLLKLHPSKW
ncbi:MAG: hypothetical protein WA945_03230 [Arcobacteraceae bacterium]